MWLAQFSVWVLRNNTGHSAPRQKRLVSKTCCFTSTEARWHIRDNEKRGNGGGWVGGGGVSGSSTRSYPQNTEEAVDHQQNNNYVKAVGTSPVGSNLCTPLLNCCFNCCVEQSHKDSVRSTTVEEEIVQSKGQSNFLSLAPPALDLSCALLRVQLTSLFLISRPGLCKSDWGMFPCWESSSPPSSWSLGLDSTEVIEACSRVESPAHLPLLDLSAWTLQKWLRHVPALRVQLTSLFFISRPGLCKSDWGMFPCWESSSPPSSWSLGLDSTEVIEACSRVESPAHLPLLDLSAWTLQKWLRHVPVLRVQLTSLFFISRPGLCKSDWGMFPCWQSSSPPSSWSLGLDSTEVIEACSRVESPAHLPLLDLSAWTLQKWLRHVPVLRVQLTSLFLISRPGLCKSDWGMFPCWQSSSPPSSWSRGLDSAKVIEACSRVENLWPFLHGSHQGKSRPMLKTGLTQMGFLGRPLLLLLTFLERLDFL